MDIPIHLAHEKEGLAIPDEHAQTLIAPTAVVRRVTGTLAPVLAPVKGGYYIEECSGRIPSPTRP